jgi:hypothetical protein
VPYSGGVRRYDTHETDRQGRRRGNSRRVCCRLHHEPVLAAAAQHHQRQLPYLHRLAELQRRRRHGYILASQKSLDCVFLNKEGTESAQYTGTIDKVGIDIGYTKAVHTIWRVYSLGNVRGPNNLGGTYVGEQGTAAAGSQAGGNWIYGGANAEVGMLASGIVKDAGYNLAAGVAAMTIKLKP